MGRGHLKLLPGRKDWLQVTLPFNKVSEGLGVVHRKGYFHAFILNYSYDFDLSYSPFDDPVTVMTKDLEEGTGMSIFFYFKDILIVTQTEYLVCDYSCLIGEIGGNLGFFLGGSVLALIDLIVNQIKKRGKSWFT